jgi:site-specific DNA-cytosine methylase
MKYFSAFSGIGGFELAMPKDWECVGYSEILPSAIKIYSNHFDHKNYGDITKINPKQLPDFDLFVGGFPCQAFSVAGKRAGFKDTRGVLIFDVFRILKEKKPKLILLENVKGLLSSHTTLTFSGILDTLATELSIKENICETKILIKHWKTEADNLGYYLRTSDGEGGLMRKLKLLPERILQIIKRQNLFRNEQTHQLGEQEKEWVLNLYQLSSIEGLNTEDTHLLEKMVAINAIIVSSLKKKLGDLSREQKLSTTLTETNLTIDLKTCISAVQEVNIILFIVKQWRLSTPLWNKIKLNSLTANTYYVKTFNIIISELDKLGYDVEWCVYNSTDFGRPQSRPRVYIAGAIRGSEGSSQFSERIKQETPVLFECKERFRNSLYNWEEIGRVSTRIIRDYAGISIDKKIYYN